MKVIRVDLPKDIDILELHSFADEHIGDSHCDLPRLRKRIEYVEQTPNAYCVLNGDILDYASRSSIGDIETRNLNIMDQLDTSVDLFMPIRKKILAMTNGNHENRGYRKEGFDISREIATRLGIADRYSPTSAFIFLRFGSVTQDKNCKSSRKQHYTIYVNHGSGGGRKEGAKAIRLADMASICDADIYIHSHTHLPMTMKEAFFRVDVQNRNVVDTTKLFVNTASNLRYGGYGAAQEHKPNSMDTPTIYLSGHARDMTAKL